MILITPTFLPFPIFAIFPSHAVLFSNWDPNDADEVDDFIDSLWDYANKQETVFVDTGQLGKLGVNLEFDIDLDNFKPF